MKCRYCKMRLVGMEEVDGICFDCQESVEDAENLNELNRYRETFPVPPWSTDPITPELCERLGMQRASDADEIGVYAANGIEVEFTNIGPDIWFMGTRIPEAVYTSGQLACLVTARKTNEKH